MQDIDREEEQKIIDFSFGFSIFWFDVMTKLRLIKIYVIWGLTAAREIFWIYYVITDHPNEFKQDTGHKKKQKLKKNLGYLRY